MKLLRTCSLALCAAMLVACASPQTSARAPLACDDGIKTAFKPDAQTRVIAVRRIAKGTQVTAVDSGKPVTAARDMCLVKLLVGPGATAEKDKTARSYTEGIGMEVWLPDGWNERIRNYGGGGWVGGGHRDPEKIGSKVPAIAMANMGFASGTHDGGQPWYQDASFAFLSNGTVNLESMQDMSRRAMYEQAVKTRALVEAYYGRAPRYTYYDGHSTGGRQGLKVAQEWPQQYDGYLIAQPAVNASLFGLAALYPQIVMKSDLGISALDKPAATAYARKVSAATARAVASCDKEKLGYLVDPASCAYDPVARCRRAVHRRRGRRRHRHERGCRHLHVRGRGPRPGQDLVRCHHRRQLRPAADPRRPRRRGAGAEAALVGSPERLQPDRVDRQCAYRPARAHDAGRALRCGRIGQLGRAHRQHVDDPAQSLARAHVCQLRGGAATRAHRCVPARAPGGPAPTSAGLRDGGRKVLFWNGLADDVIPPAGATFYYERVTAWAGGEAQVQRFMRMYNIPGMAHSSQGRGFTVSGANDTVAMPALPGDNNQLPVREQDQMFTALQDWVERGTAPETIVISSRDHGTSLPACVYPKKPTWNGSGPARSASSYSCL